MGRMESPDRTKRVTIRVPGDLLDDYDDLCDDQGTNRSEKIRTHMQQATSDAELTDRVMPETDQLATAYRALLRLTNGGGAVDRDRACKYLSQQVTYVDQDTAYGVLIKPLRKAGYIRQTVSSDGQSVGLHIHA